MVTTLASILILGLLILVHEAGHFVVARWAGVRVLRFSMGFGPRLLTWKRGHTEYALSLLPLGGYVKMAGEQRAELKAEPWEYLSKPVGIRALIVFAGPVVNYLTAILTLWVVFVVGYPELRPTVGKLLEDMPAQAAGLAVGDRIVAIDDHAVETWDELTKQIYGAPGHPLRLRVARHGDETTITVVPKARDITDPYGQAKTVGMIGITPSGEFTPLRYGPVEAIGQTFAKHGEWCASMGKAVSSLIMGRISMQESLTGPIGIVYLTSEAVRLGFTTVLFLVSLFSLSLAIFNVLPIPILDGGHLFFLGMEKLRGNPVSLTVQERAAQVSLLLLVTMVVMVCVSDIKRYELVEKAVEWIRH